MEAISFRGTAIPAPASRDDVKTLHQLSRACQLRNVVFRELHSKLASESNGAEKLYLEHSLSAEATLNERRLVVVLLLNASLSTEESDPSPAKQVLTIRCEVAIDYALPSSLKATPAAIGAFAFINAAQAAWPFLREATHDLASRCGFPMLLLPVRRLHSHDEVDPEDGRNGDSSHAGPSSKKLKTHKKPK